MQKKRTLEQEQLAQLCSQIVCFFSFLCFFKFRIFAEITIKNRGFQPNKKTKKKKKNNKFYKLKIGPSIS